MRRWTITLVLGLLALQAGPLRADDSGLARIERVGPAPVLAQQVPRLPEADFQTTMHRDRLDGAIGGRGWWRLHPAPGQGERLLLVFHPYSARVTVLLPPDYQPQVRSVFDRDLDPRYSRRAMVFPLASAGPVYVGVEGARYPLQVAVQPVSAYAVRDRSHVRVLYTALGVLVGVCLVALVFWAILRDRVHLLYAGCMLTQLLYLLCGYGEAYSMPGLSLLAAFGTPGIWLVATLSTVVSVFFLLDFAELRVRVPRLGRALTWAGAWLPLATLVMLPLTPNKAWFPPLGNGLLLLANVLAVLCLVVAWRRGGRQAGMMLLAWVPLVVVSTARVVQLGSGSPLAPWLEYGLPITLAYTAVVLMVSMADRMRTFRHERDRAQETAERDPLTGVLNRAGIEHRLDWALTAAEGEYLSLSVLFLDLDHFKRINDTHGHAVGDACLGALVRILTAELQFGDKLGRLGGEEFLVLLPGANRRRARDIAEHIRRSVEHRCREIAGLPLGLTVSVGVAEAHRRDTAASLIARADHAMYQAKRAGRNRVVTAEATAEMPAELAG